MSKSTGRQSQAAAPASPIAGGPLAGGPLAGGPIAAGPIESSLADSPAGLGSSLAQSLAAAESSILASEEATLTRALRRAPARPREIAQSQERPCAPSQDRSEAPSHGRTLLDIFDATLAAHGKRLAIDADDVKLTYRELSRSADALAQRLRAQGVGPGDRVGVRVPSGTSGLYVAILGVLRAGAAYVPVDADDPQVRASELLSGAGACALVGEGLSLTELAPSGGSKETPTPADDAWVIFTSGSTGAPKGVAVTHSAAAAFVEAEASLWSVAPEDRVLAGLSVAFDASCEEMWLAWRNGAALVPAPRAIVRAGAELGPWLKRRSISVVSTVPTLAALWDQDALSGVRLLILGGEACPDALAWRLSADREVWNTYGPTEATVVSTAAKLQPGEEVTIGWPLRGWMIAVVDEQGEPVSIGEPGELVIAGAGLARYLDDGLDAARFAPLPALGWQRAYRTGDVVRETIEGLHFVGRRDDQVKIGGRRIELGEIDAGLAQAPGVKEALTAVKETAAGNKVLVGYLAGDLDLSAVRRWLVERLPEGLVPLLVELEALPRSASGKLDRKALPWPPPSEQARSAELDGLGELGSWLADQWAQQLGPLPIDPESDFFQMGGSSLTAAKLVSCLRERFPSVAVADIYNNRTLAAMTERLRSLTAGGRSVPATRSKASLRWSALHLSGVLSLLVLAAPQWVIGTLVLNLIYPGGLAIQVGWVWLVLAWVVLGSRPGRAMIVAGLRHVMLRGVRPGRYPRHSWLTMRIWMLERLAEMFHLDGLAGTPWAARYARIVGHDVGKGVRLASLPAPASLIHVGEHATLEGDVDIHGWWIEGDELVIAEVRIGARARIGTRALLMPGAEVGEGAEIEPGSVVSGRVPAGERWAGAPARKVGVAGESWPLEEAPPARHPGFWKAMFVFGAAFDGMLALLAAAPGIVMILLLRPSHPALGAVVVLALEIVPLGAVAFVTIYALLVAFSVRAVSRLLKPGLHPAEGAVGWALWFGESMMADARDVLFPLYSSIFTGPWLRLAGIDIGRRTEISTAVGLNRFVTFADRSFAADDVVFAGARARGGWVQLMPIEVGKRSFLGNGAILDAGTKIGSASLVGVLTTAPMSPPEGTAWLGAPPLEIPRHPDRTDPSLTTDPPTWMVLARGGMELVRIFMPAMIAAALGTCAFWALDAVGTAAGVLGMLVVAPLLSLCAGIVACLVTIAVKWALMGRYKAGEHPLWSWFVWRDEIVNTFQEQLAGAWLLDTALGTPIMSIYLRLMGSKVGRDVWCETLTITEFELASLGDGCAVNRHSVVETHLFHDRVMRCGPASLGCGATLGPSSAMLPETTVGDGCSVGGRAVVMRGERLPPGTRWHGAPVVAL